MDIPETRYARSGDVSIAYEVFGDGPLDLVIVHGFFSHVETDWEWPPFAHLLRRLASFARVITFDKRGTGLSDPIEGAPTLEERMDDIRAVMDAAGSEQATVLGYSEGGPMSMLFSAAHPERVSALILYGSFARVLHAPDYPVGVSPDFAEAFLEGLRANWPNPRPELGQMIWPSVVDDPSFNHWMGRRARLGASPRMAVEIMRLNLQIDVRAILPEIRVPTLVLHREGDRFVPVAYGRFLAERIPEARYVELAGDDHSPFTGDVDALVDEVEEFLTGARGHDIDRVLATVLFTDIVDSTSQAAAAGDRDWRALLDRHDETVRREVERFRGRVVKTTGDGALATFDGPARAIRCARHLTDTLSRSGLRIRAGLHSGECELRGEDIAGVAVHIGARIGDLAAPGEVLVSGTVKDLVIGSGIDFSDRGTHELKGVPGRWPIFAVAG